MVMMKKEEVDNLIENMIPENLQEKSKMEMERLRYNLEQIDRALPILFRSISNFEQTLKSQIPEELNDESWEAFLAYASQVWHDHMKKFQETPLNGAARNMFNAAMNGIVEKMK